MSSSEFDGTDFFRTKSLYQDPYPYYEYLRDQGPVWREPHNGVVMVTGFQEAMSVYRDGATFSSCNAVSGPFPEFPVPLVGDDVSALIEQYRDELPFSDQLPTFDPPRHTEHRGLLMRLITPKRLKENEEFMWRLADRQIDEFLDRGECEFIHDYANPFTLLVIADLLGVPEADHASFRDELQGTARPTRQRGKAGAAMAHKPLEFLYERFTAYIEECRREPRDDVMTELATATFPDGSLPEINDVMLIAGNLFAAGQETTARLLGQMLRFLAERPELQELLRHDRSQIANLVEEALRLESPIQGDFRLSRVPVTVGGVDLPAGTTLMLVNGAANRDPREFDHPDELRLDRVNGRQHLGFGFGIHTCAGAPLARAEARVTFERILDRMGDIRISDAVHGPAGARHYEYTPIYMLRGLERLQIEFSPLVASDWWEVTSMLAARARERDSAVPTSEQELRDELRSWLVEHPPPRVVVAGTDEEAGVLREWQRTLHAAGWVGIHWPVEYGGRGASLAQVAVYNEELARADAPPLLGRAGISLVGPTLMAHGTDEQRRRWMPRILSGEDVWCQLFSEPDAGSDLAALSTRAEICGGVYRVSGQKVWSSYARFADWGIALGADGPERPQPQGNLDAGRSDDGEGRGDPAAAPDDRGERVQRGVPRRRRGPARVRHRSGARRLARREHDAGQRAGRVVRLEGAGAPPGGDGAARARLCSGEVSSTTRALDSVWRRPGSRWRSSASTTSERSRGSSAARRSVRSRAWSSCSGRG